MSKKDRDFKGVWIPKSIWLDKSLSLVEKCLLVEIDSLDNDPERGCFADDSHFAEFLNLSEKRVQNVMTDLKKRGHLTRCYWDGRNRGLRVLNPENGKAATPINGKADFPKTGEANPENGSTKSRKRDSPYIRTSNTIKNTVKNTTTTTTTKGQIVDDVENCLSESVDQNRATALEAKKEKRNPPVAPANNPILKIELWNKENVRFTASMIIGESKGAKVHTCADFVFNQSGSSNELPETLRSLVLNMTNKLLTSICNQSNQESQPISTPFEQLDAVSLSQEQQKLLLVTDSEGSTYSIRLQINQTDLLAGSVQIAASTMPNKHFLILTVSSLEKMAVNMLPGTCVSYAPIATNAGHTNLKNGIKPPPLTWPDAETQMLDARISIEAKAMNLKISVAQVQGYMTYFVREQIGRGKPAPEKLEDALSHFSNWLPFRLKEEKKESEAEPKGRIAQIKEGTRRASEQLLESLEAGTFKNPLFDFKT